jgi:hypothetical protein
MMRICRLLSLDCNVRLSKSQFPFRFLNMRVLNFQWFLLVSWFRFRLAMPGQSLVSQPPVNGMFDELRNFNGPSVLAASDSSAGSECGEGSRRGDL